MTLDHKPEESSVALCRWLKAKARDVLHWEKSAVASPSCFSTSFTGSFRLLLRNHEPSASCKVLGLGQQGKAELKVEVFGYRV